MKQQPLTVEELIKTQRSALRLRLIAGEGGLNRQIRIKELDRPGLALTGFTELFPAERIQLIGESEILYIKKLGFERQKKVLEGLFDLNIPCIIITNRKKAPQVMKGLADAKNIPLLASNLSTTEMAFRLSNFLNDHFAPTENIHGTLVDVYGTGLLFIGRAGIGKSEIALDLVERGHRLVADDIVILTKKTPGLLLGTGPEMLKHLIEIRGVGVLDVREMFGVRSVRLQKRVETVVELLDWDGKEDYERLGLDEKTCEYLGMQIPLIRLPIYPGKNITVIAEAIALNLHLKVYGYDVARNLSKRLSANIKDKKRISDYLKWDDE
ncbi:MAG: HPr(Ser) kinase/phosphatase [Calditrichaeota bacterium]|nr:HPr(Ser) kinase/phosphatase [Calditrichota bacterium]